MDEPIKVDSIPEEYDYIAGLRCDRCGGGYRVVRQALLLKDGNAQDAFEVVCRTCGQAKGILFDISSFFGK
jgi:hypothetical protein